LSAVLDKNQPIPPHSKLWRLPRLILAKILALIANGEEYLGTTPGATQIDLLPKPFFGAGLLTTSLQNILFNR